MAQLPSFFDTDSWMSGVRLRPHNPKPMKAFSHSKEAIVAELNFYDVKHLNDWLASDLWRPYFEEFFNDFFGPYVSECEQNEVTILRGPDFSDIQEHLEDNMARQVCKFIGNVDKTDWEEIDHYAYFLHCVVESNMNHIDGLFIGKPLLPEERNWQAYEILVYEKKQFSSSKRKRKEQAKSNREKKLTLTTLLGTAPAASSTFGTETLTNNIAQDQPDIPMITTPSTAWGGSRVQGQSNLETFHHSKYALVTGLQLNNEADLNRWLASDLWRPFFERFVNDYLKPHFESCEEANKPLKRTPSFRLIVEYLRLEEGRGRHRFSSEPVDKTGWNDMDHYAYYLHCVVRANTGRSDSIFHGRSMTPDEQYWAAFQVLTYFKRFFVQAKHKNQEKAQAAYEAEWSFEWF